MSHVEDPAERVDGDAPLPKLPDEHVDADAVRGDVARDDEVLGASPAVLLPKPAQVTRIDVDIENGVDAVVEGRLRDRIPAVRARPVNHDPFSESVPLVAHPDNDFSEGLLEFRQAA